MLTTKKSKAKKDIDSWMTDQQTSKKDIEP